MAFTSDGKRNYKCKRCGKWTVEDLKQWNSKPQAKKNICPVCVEKAKLKQLQLKERITQMCVMGRSNHGYRVRYESKNKMGQLMEVSDKHA